MSKKSRQRAKRKRALQHASRYAFMGLTLGTGLGISIFIIAVSVTPSISPKQVADAVRSQSVRGESIKLATQTSNLPSALTLPNSNSIPASPDGQSFVTVGFEQLAGFRFAVTDQLLDSSKDPKAPSERTLEQLPLSIKALDRHGVSVKGYMLPMKFNGSLATDFLLMRNQSLCCYGMPPKITEWVNVHMAGKGVKPLMDQPVIVSGTFHVGDVRENGDLVGIYQIDAQKLTHD